MHLRACYEIAHQKKSWILTLLSPTSKFYLPVYIRFAKSFQIFTLKKKRWKYLDLLRNLNFYVGRTPEVE